MIQLIDHGVYLYNGEPLGDGCAPAAAPAPQDAREQTMAYRILRAHDQGGDEAHLRVKFDSLTSHDITYVGILQTAKASAPWAVLSTRTTTSLACPPPRSTAASSYPPISR